MPAYRISASRHGGVCAVEYFHDITIQPSQRTFVTTYFASDEHVRDFGVEPLSAHRVCLTCTASKLRELDRIGLLGIVSGLRDSDLTAAGLVTAEDIEKVNDALAAITDDGAAVASDVATSLGDFRA